MVLVVVSVMVVIVKPQSVPSRRFPGTWARREPKFPWQCRHLRWNQLIKKSVVWRCPVRDRKAYFPSLRPSPSCLLLGINEDSYPEYFHSEDEGDKPRESLSSPLQEKLMVFSQRRSYHAILVCFFPATSPSSKHHHQRNTEAPLTHSYNFPTSSCSAP